MISPYESISRRQISKRRAQKRVEKTSLDYLVAAFNPLLIMLLVGSLVFFLIQVFYQGEMTGGVRWVLFWFVLAIVLVSRIGIEQSPVHAGIYGAGLAAASWLFLMQTHPAFLLGIVCLAVVWWSAHRLVKDCTLIDDEQDASHRGLLTGRTGEPDKKPQAAPARQSKTRRANKDKQTACAPGRWVLYFSLAALPLFGLGQLLTESRNSGAGPSGFHLLLAYLIAACGLLLSTSFLGMRRYLRQRAVKMPGNIAGAWLLSGGLIGGAVLLLALLAPRPGAGAAWGGLTGKIDHWIQEASEIAMRFNPAGTGQGREGRHSVEAANAARNNASHNTSPKNDGNPSAQGLNAQSLSGHQSQPSGRGHSENAAGTALHRILKSLLILAACIAAAIFLYRYRKLLAALIQAVWQAVAHFLHNLLPPSSRHPAPAGKSAGFTRTSPPAPFRSFRDPFASGQAERWPSETLLVYSYEALQSWAKETGIPDSPNETPVERSRSLALHHPELHPWVLSLGEHYSLLAYGKRLPQAIDTRSLRRIWTTIIRPVSKQTPPTRPHNPNAKSI